MARCNNEVLLKKVGLDNLDQNTEIDFRIRRDLPDCRKINTKDYVATSSTTALAYNRYRKPANRFECGRKGCLTSGLLMMNAANENVTFRAMFDATEFPDGVVTYYVYPDPSLSDTDYPVTVTFMISENDAFTNADVYTTQITKAQITDDGFVPVMVNLVSAPSSVEGTGWNASDTGAYIRLSADKKVGYSSIAIYNSIDDFDLMETVTISCLTTAGGTFDLEVIAQQCQETKLNDQVSTLTYPITGTKISPNYMNLFPMIGKGDKTRGFDMVTTERTIGPDGRITLADANQDVCGFITVQADDSCDVSTYTMSSAINPADVDEGHYIVVKNTDGTTNIVFNSTQAGIKVLVRYPKSVEIEEFVANAENLNSSQVSMTVPHKLSDGTKLLYVFDNVYITSFPATVANADTNFSFTITIGRNDNGDFFRIQRINA